MPLLRDERLDEIPREEDDRDGLRAPLGRLDRAGWRCTDRDGAGRAA